MSNVLKESLGIDVSKESLSYCLCRLHNDLSKSFELIEEVSNDTKGFSVLDRWVRKHHQGSVLPVIVMESTGVYHENLSHYFHGKGYGVSVMQSGRVKRYAQSLDQRSKTDSLDSKMLSILGCERELPLWGPPSEQMQHLRLLSRERAALIKERSIELNRLSALISSSYVEGRVLRRHQSRLSLLKDQISEIESEMQSLLADDASLSQKMK